MANPSAPSSSMAALVSALGKADASDGSALESRGRSEHSSVQFESGEAGWAALLIISHDLGMTLDEHYCTFVARFVDSDPKEVKKRRGRGLSSGDPVDAQGNC